MRFAIVEDGVVVNIIEADEQFGVAIGAIPVCDIGVGIGTEYKDGKFNVQCSREEFILKDPVEIIIPVELTIEERLNLQEQANMELKKQLEVTQAVVDELLFGGAL